MGNVVFFGVVHSDSGYIGHTNDFDRSRNVYLNGQA